MAKYVKTEQGYVDASIFAPAQFKPEGKSYLTFSSPKNFTLEVNNRTKNWDGILEYFAYDKTWTVWDGTTILSAYNNDAEYVLYLRGTGNKEITGFTNGQEYKWVLTGSEIACTGNIENLLDYGIVESGGHPTMASYCYSSMFYGCTALTQAPDLPATTLASHCYRGMFLNCNSLTKAPKLPATTLSDYCYQEMFSGCTSLTQAPALPATTLANRCYWLMFFNCNSLTQAPALPATTLASHCYNSMFNYCTSLTQAPALPATTLASNCYSYMFSNCTSLTQAPKLPATTLASYCYDGMFYACTRLTQAPALPATTLSVCCYRGMFTGCISLTKAPALPATTLSDYCYPTMFSGCISLIQIPALPATTLASNCYTYMFERCTALKLSSTKTVEYEQEYRIPTTGTGTTATDALTNMFVSTGGTFTGTPAINTTYYLSTDNVIVRDTEVATLNGYVGSMIDNSVSNPLNITGATVGQIAKITAVDESGKPTSWEAVDIYKKPTSGIPKSDLAQSVQTSLDKADTAISLGLTTATPGQLIKVKTVQDGKPTEWEAVDMDARKLPKFTKLLTHTITEDELAASPIAFIWGTAQIPNLNDFNVFALTIVRPDGAKIEFNKWVKIKINSKILGNICGTNTAASPQYVITANRLFGFWISGNYYDARNIGVPVLVPPQSSSTYQSDLPDSEPVTSIGFTSYAADYGLTAGIVVEIWGAK